MISRISPKVPKAAVAYIALLASQLPGFWEGRHPLPRVLDTDTYVSLYIEGPVSRAHVSYPYEHHVYHGPDSQAPKAEQLSDAFSPVAQVEPAQKHFTVNHQTIIIIKLYLEDGQSYL